MKYLVLAFGVVISSVAAESANSQMGPMVLRLRSGVGTVRYRPATAKSADSAEQFPIQTLDYADTLSVDPYNDQGNQDSQKPLSPPASLVKPASTETNSKHAIAGDKKIGFGRWFSRTGNDYEEDDDEDYLDQSEYDAVARHRAKSSPKAETDDVVQKLGVFDKWFSRTGNDYESEISEDSFDEDELDAVHKYNEYDSDDEASWLSRTGLAEEDDQEDVEKEHKQTKTMGALDDILSKFGTPNSQNVDAIESPEVHQKKADLFRQKFQKSMGDFDDVMSQFGKRKVPRKPTPQFKESTRELEAADVLPTTEVHEQKADLSRQKFLKSMGDFDDLMSQFGKRKVPTKPTPQLNEESAPDLEAADVLPNN